MRVLPSLRVTVEVVCKGLGLRVWACFLHGGAEHRHESVQQGHCEGISLNDRGDRAKDVAEKARQRPDGSGRELRVTVGDDVPKLLFADVDKVEQILTNLVNNALRYAPESVVRLDVTAWGEGGVRIDVADDGPGIPTEQQRTIFQKFGRGRESRRAGTGLGLYITRGLARAHGGDVVVDSTPGEGATFTLTLPPGDAPG